MTALGARLLRLAVVIAIVSFFSFLLLDLVPGDPVAALLGFNASPEAVAAKRAELGLDGGILTRYGRWLGDAVQGDLGNSFVNDVAVSSQIRTALPKTLQLIVMAQIMALLISVPTAIAAARRPGGIVDRVASAAAFGFLALPSFVLGVYLVAVIAVRWGWLPSIATNIPGLDDDPIENLRQMFLPALTLALNLVAVYLRLLRSDLITTLQQDYILLARARGLGERRILWRHALRPSSLSLLTAVGLNTGALIGGTVIIEQLFAIPGMGRLVLQAIFLEDYPVVQAVVLLFSVGYVLFNFAVDLLYAVVDPRIRHAAARG